VILYQKNLIKKKKQDKKQVKETKKPVSKKSIMDKASSIYDERDEDY